jgi:hypothetical protein
MTQCDAMYVKPRATQRKRKIGGVFLIVITTNGEVGEIPINGPLTGKGLVAVILTRDDDKPELMDVLKTNVFPRFPGADVGALLSQTEPGIFIRFITIKDKYLI